jgi:thiol:disulfide interchange protein
MAAAFPATQKQQVASPQPWFTVRFRTIVQAAVAALILGGLQQPQAAELPQTFSDSSPVADNTLNPNPILQTNSKVLPVDAAFALTTFVEADTSIVLRWEMPPAYYLYQKSLVVETADGKPIKFELPEAKTITDEFFGEVAVYYDSLLLRLPFSALNAKPGTTVELLLTYQGCAEALYCYPPAQKALTLTLPE